MAGLRGGLVPKATETLPSESEGQGAKLRPGQSRCGVHA